MVGKTETHRQTIPLYFDASALGASLQELAVDVVRGENTDFLSRWFRSKNSDADLFIWFDGEKRIIKAQLCFFGQVVEWNPLSGTRTGVIIEEEMAASPHNGAEVTEDAVSETIRFDEKPQQTAVAQAIHVLVAVTELSETEREILIFNLRESPRLHKKARERAIKVWAPKIAEITSSHRPSFWKRMRNWVLGE